MVTGDIEQEGLRPEGACQAEQPLPGKHLCRGGIVCSQEEVLLRKVRAQRALKGKQLRIVTKETPRHLELRVPFP